MMLHSIYRKIDGRQVHVADLVNARHVVLSESWLRNPATDLCKGRVLQPPARVAYSLTADGWTPNWA